MKYDFIADILDGKVSTKAKLRGWIHRKRDQKKMVFLMLRDSTGVIQLACKDKILEKAREATIESSVEIEGKIKKDDRAPGGYEIQVDKIKIVGLAESPFPIGKDLSDEFTRDVRHLWLRSRKLSQTLRVSSEVFKAIREFYYSKKYTEFQSPIFTKADCEGGSTLFEVPYFGKKGVYLSQSWQLHAEAAIFGLEKIFTIAPAFRAEKSRTIRHLSEYWTAEAEVAYMDFEAMMKEEEELILYVVKHVLKHCKRELEELGRDTKDLEKLKGPFKKIKYEDVLKELGKKWGHDITDKEERELVKKYGKPIFITHFPRDMKAFYMKVDPKDSRVVFGADLLIPGVGEVIGGSERISDLEELMESIKIFKLKKEDYQWYIDLRKYGTVPHSGYGIGLGRLIMWITGSKHIMDTVAFPRTMERIYP